MKRRAETGYNGQVSVHLTECFRSRCSPVPLLLSAPPALGANSIAQGRSGGGP